MQIGQSSAVSGHQFTKLKLKPGHLLYLLLKLSNWHTQRMFDIHSLYLHMLEGLIISHWSINIFGDAWCHAVHFALLYYLLTLRFITKLSALPSCPPWPGHKVGSAEVYPASSARCPGRVC